MRTSKNTLFLQQKQQLQLQKAVLKQMQYNKQ